MCPTPLARLVLCSLLAFVLHTSIATAQSIPCGEFSAELTVPGIARTSIQVSPLYTSAQVWDPDGPGPAAPILVVANTGFAGNEESRGLSVWDGSNWSTFPDPDAGPFRILVIGDDLYSFGRKIRRYSFRGVEQLGGDNQSVSSCLPWNDSVVISGLLNLDGQTEYATAIWRNDRWERLGTTPRPQDMTAFVQGIRGLLVHDGHLLAHGSFGRLASGGFEAFARLEDGVWVPFAPGLLPQVSIFEAATSAVSFQGELLATRGVPELGIRRWDGGAWVRLGELSRLPGVRTLQVYEDQLYAFTTGGGAYTTASGIHRWTGTVWQPPEERGSPCTNYAEHGADRIIRFNGELYATGSIWTTPIQSPGITKLTDSGWMPVGPGINGIVTLAIPTPSGYAAFGTFNSVDGKIAFGAAERIDGRWHPMNAGLAPPSPNHGRCSAPAGNFRAATEWQGRIAVSGYFSLTTGVTNVAAWDGASWRGLPRLSLRPNQEITALATLGNDLIAAGPDSVHRWDGVAWHSLGPSQLVQVASLVVYNGRLFIGGNITNPDTGATLGLAQWDGLRWVDTGIAPLQRVTELEVIGSNLYIVSTFPSGFAQVLRWDRKILSPAASFPWYFQNYGVRLGSYRGDLVGYSYGFLWIVRDGIAQELARMGQQTIIHFLQQVGDRLLIGTNQLQSISLPDERRVMTPYLFSWTGDNELRISRSSASIGTIYPFTETIATTYGCGFGALRFSWSRNGQPLPAGPSPSGSIIAFDNSPNASALRIASPGPADSGTYECTLVDELGRTASTSYVRAFRCPSDVAGAPYGGDFAVTIEDLVAYFDFYAAANQRADLDDGSGSGRPDSAVTIEDLLFFLTAYERGC